MSEENMVFDNIDLAETTVMIAGQNYVLREANEGAAVRYRDAMLKGTRFGSDGKPTGFDGVAGAESLLVSLCLFKFSVDKDGTNRFSQVPVGTIQGWPTRVRAALGKWVKEHSGLGDETIEELRKQRDELDNRIRELEEASQGKNEPSGTTTTSQ